MLARGANIAAVAFFGLTDLVAIVGAATCYMPDGTATDKLVPCNPNAAVSLCCGASDFCLSNGLCLNAGGNNGYSIQGCTSESWASPCNMRCPVSKKAYDGYLYMQLCSGLNGVDNPFCCGDDFTCCSTPSNIITTIPLWQALSRPGGDSSTSTTPPSNLPTGQLSTTSSETGPAATKSSTSSQSSGAAPSQSADAAASGGVDKSLAIGAGVGIPLGLALIAALVFLGWQLRKQNQVASSKLQPPYFPSPDTGSSMAHPANTVYYTPNTQHSAPPMQQIPGQAHYYSPTGELHGNSVQELPAKQ